MSAAPAIVDRLTAFGVTLKAGPDGLEWAASAEPPADLLEGMKQDRGAILDYLTQGQAPSSGTVPWRLDRDQPPPEGVNEARWQEAISTSCRFLSEWGPSAAAMGWRDVDVFGVHPAAPFIRFDSMGLAVTLRDGQAVALIAAHEAKVRTPSGGVLTYRRRPLPGSQPIWMLCGGGAA